jgi:hypothetical protein
MPKKSHHPDPGAGKDRQCTDLPAGRSRLCDEQIARASRKSKSRRKSGSARLLLYRQCLGVGIFAVDVMSASLRIGQALQ